MMRPWSLVVPCLAGGALVVAQGGCETPPLPAPAPVGQTAAPLVSQAPVVAAAVPAPARSPWTVPQDVSPTNAPTQTDWYDLGWQTFVALAWPAVAPTAAQSGQPDPASVLGANQGGVYTPPVWLNYRSLQTTMLAAGAAPGTWTSISAMTPPPAGCAPMPPGSVTPGFQPLVLDLTSKEATGTGIDFIDEASGNPLIDQRGWYVIYDVRMNQSEYTYITKNGYYDAKNQLAAFAPGGPGFVGFPRTGQETDLGPPLPAYAQFGALEVKTAWRVLDPSKDTVSRFYTQTGYFIQPDGKTCQGPVLFGLVGLHILRLTPTTPSTWYWATFEQVDNTSVPPGSPMAPSLAAPNTPNGSCTAANNQPPATVSGNIPWNNTNKPVNACRVTNLTPDLVAENARWQQQAPVKGTVWQNYQLVGTLNPSVAGGPAFPIPVSTATVNVNTLANVAIETYSQAGTRTPSCMTCHGAGGFPQGAPQTSTNQIFTFLLGNADSSTTPGLHKRGARHPKKR